MSIKLKNMDKTLKDSFESVDVLNLSIPKTYTLPFGATVQYMDLVSARDEGRMGDSEFYFRLFCLFTWRLPKGQRVSYDWLADQDLDPAEVEEIVRATNELLTHYAEGQQQGEAEEGEKGKAKTKGGKKLKN